VSKHEPTYGGGEEFLGEFKKLEMPELEDGDVTIESIGCGGEHTMIVMSSGQAVGFGSNHKGMLGIVDGQTKEPTVATQWGPALLRYLQEQGEVHVAACGGKQSLVMMYGRWDVEDDEEDVGGEGGVTEARMKEEEVEGKDAEGEVDGREARKKEEAVGEECSGDEAAEDEAGRMLKPKVTVVAGEADTVAARRTREVRTSNVSGAMAATADGGGGSGVGAELATLRGATDEAGPKLPIRLLPNALSSGPLGAIGTSLKALPGATPLGAIRAPSPRPRPVLRHPTAGGSAGASPAASLASVPVATAPTAASAGAGVGVGAATAAPAALLTVGPVAAPRRKNKLAPISAARQSYRSSTYRQSLLVAESRRSREPPAPVAEEMLEMDSSTDSGGEAEDVSGAAGESNDSERVGVRPSLPLSRAAPAFRLRVAAMVRTAVSRFY
jgi:hypothetical protein